MSNPSMLPNPNVYLNYLTPEVAFAWELARDIDLVTCGASLWDILSTISEDWKFLRRLNAGVIAYGLCRPAAFLFVMTTTITKSMPLRHCRAMLLVSTCSLMIATCTSSFLFLLRIQAVYSHSKVVRYVFFILWLAQVGLSVLNPIGVYTRPLYDTGYCTNRAKRYVIAATSMPPFFDTLVFAAISYRLVTRHANDDVPSHWRTFFLGKALPRLSKAMLQGGQQYYLLTVGMNITTLAFFASASTPKMLQVISVVPGVAFTSIMACTVQRKLFTGTMQGTEEETVESLGLSFTDTTSFLARLYGSQGGTDNTGHHTGAQNGIPGVKTLPTADSVM